MGAALCDVAQGRRFWGGGMGGVTATGRGHEATRASACHAVPLMVITMSRGTGRPCSGSFRDVPWAQDTWGALPVQEQGWGMATPPLTLIPHTARRQEQVIDGNGPCATGHPLNQHLQGSTTPAMSTWGDTGELQDQGSPAAMISQHGPQGRGLGGQGRHCGWQGCVGGLTGTWGLRVTVLPLYTSMQLPRVLCALRRPPGAIGVSSRASWEGIGLCGWP